MLNKTVTIQELCSYLLAFQSSTSFSSKTFTSDDFLVVADMGCSITCTHDINYFELNTYTTSHQCMLTRISSGLNIVCSGFVDWTFPNTNGKPVTLCLHVIHVPNIPMCLLLPQQIMVVPHQSHDKNHYLGTPTGLVLVYDGHLIHFLYNEASHLPVLKTMPGTQHYFAFCAQINSSYTSTAHPTPFYAQAFRAYAACAPRVHFDPSLDPDPPDDHNPATEILEFQDMTSLSATQRDHLSSIAMIWNPITRLVSTQYHVIFDEGFQTVSSLSSMLNDDAIQAAFGTLLKSIEWLHSDKYAATNQIETQHYYFNNDWDLISHQGDLPQDYASQHHHKHHCQSSKQDSTTQVQHRDIPAAPPPATSKGALADSLELLDPMLLSQPLPDPSPGLSEDHLPSNILSQLCAIHVDNPAQPQLADLEESIPDQAPQDTNVSINSLIAAFLARE